MDRYDVDLERWLFWFVLFVGAFAVLFNFNRALYQSVKSIWNARMGTVWNVFFFTGYRFGFVWMDENNIAYMITTIAFFLIVSKKFTLFEKMCIFGINLLVVVSSMSSGGRGSLIIVWSIYVVYQLFNIGIGKNRVSFSRYVSVKSLMSLIFVIVAIIIASKYLPQYFNSTVFLESEARAEGNSMDSRFAIWTSVAKNVEWWQCIFLGSGGRTMVNGVPRAPHNGHFYWIISYGFIAYGIYVYIFFRKRRSVCIKNWIALLPFFVGFTINTMVGEPKVNEIIAVLVAYMSSPIYQTKNEEIMDYD